MPANESGLQITAMRLEHLLCGKHGAEPCRGMISRSDQNNFGWTSSQLNVDGGTEAQRGEVTLARHQNYDQNPGLADSKAQVHNLYIKMTKGNITGFLKDPMGNKKSLCITFFNIRLPGLCPSAHFAVSPSCNLPKNLDRTSNEMLRVCGASKFVSQTY